MEKTNELYFLNKYKYLTLSSSSGKTEEELSKEEKRKQKELKKKQMQEICQQKTKKSMNLPKEKKIIDDTKPGEKKNLDNFPDNYDPSYVESAWNTWWQKEAFFKVDLKAAQNLPKDKRFIMLLPPPNVTGSLHLGHSMMGAIEDTIIRYKRLKGYSALWVPGVDHAGIATQSVVEKKVLKDEGKYRTDFTREEFLKKIWDWKEEYGNRIMEQFNKLGVSFDLSRQFFTLDEQRSKSVQEAFIQLFEKGILYREKRIVNWCCALQTAISDVEMEELEIPKPIKLSIPKHKDTYEFGVLIDFAYKLKKDPSKEIIVSTTRIETMLGDTAVAVHPEDDRYKNLIGEELVHPFFPERKMKIISDDILVDKDFGTGAVKITPCHDPNDFLCGKRHNLQMINIFNDDGTLNENGGEFKGMLRYDCRNKIFERLTEMGLIRGKHPNKMVLQKCSKSGDIIEPMVKAQWWINCKDVAKRAIEEVNSGKLKIIPEFHKQTLFDFLDNIRDWCISRQLWWGHQCPIYLVTIKGILEHPDPSSNDHWVAAKSEQEAKEKAKKKWNVDDINKISVEQDSDVLDTWFSSGLLPFSVFGWPDLNSEELKTFFPTDLLETGHDIIFFWVARMIFMSYFFMDQLPFHTVYLHPIVKDKEGRKMSKSLGNVIDPLQIIRGAPLQELLDAIYAGNLPKNELERSVKEKKKEFPEGIPECGADSLRLGLMSYLIQGRNINLDLNRVVGYRFFGNKLWNAFKFLKIYTEKGFKQEKINKEKLTFYDKWILSKLSKLIIAFQKDFDNYNFGDATNKIYSFWYDCVFNRYIEALKIILSDKSPYDEETKNNTKNVFLYIFEKALIILHPFTPFLTEELFQRLPARQSKAKSICISSFPENEPFEDSEIEKIEKEIGDLIHEVQSVLQEFKLINSKPKINVYTSDKKVEEIIKKEKEVISGLAKASEILFKDKNDNEIKQWLSSVVNERMDVYLDIKDKINLDNELKRLNKTLADKEKYVNGLRTKIENKDYQKRVKEEIKKEDKDKLDKAETEIKKMKENIDNLNKLKK